MTSISGLTFLLTCKQIEEENTQVLYGGNTFAFDARGDASCGYPWTAEEKAKFRQTRWRIPGLPHPNGSPQTIEETAKAIDQLFKKGWQPKFIYEDSFFRFCSIVGRKNVAFLTRVKIEGHFKTDRRKFSTRAGLARLLPLHTAVLTNVCLDLWSLSLHMGTDTRYLYMGKGECPRTSADSKFIKPDARLIL